MTLLWLMGASSYGLLYGVFCLKQRRTWPGLAMIFLGFYPLGLGVLWLIQALS